jgi:hypothetical protein
MAAAWSTLLLDHEFLLSARGEKVWLRRQPHRARASRRIGVVADVNRGSLMVAREGVLTSCARTSPAGGHRSGPLFVAAGPRDGDLSAVIVRLFGEQANEQIAELLRSEQGSSEAGRKWSESRSPPPPLTIASTMSATSRGRRQRALIWLPPALVDRLKALRGPGEIDLVVKHWLKVMNQRASGQKRSTALADCGDFEADTLFVNNYSRTRRA